jgi:hypothetical protein
VCDVFINIRDENSPVKMQANCNHRLILVWDSWKARGLISCYL